MSLTTNAFRNIYVGIHESISDCRGIVSYEDSWFIIEIISFLRGLAYRLKQELEVFACLLQCYA